MSKGKIAFLLFCFLSAFPAIAHSQLSESFRSSNSVSPEKPAVSTNELAASEASVRGDWFAESDAAISKAEAKEAQDLVEPEKTSRRNNLLEPRESVYPSEVQYELIRVPSLTSETIERSSGDGSSKLKGLNPAEMPLMSSLLEDKQW